jgi:hypothetical protein
MAVANVPPDGVLPLILTPVRECSMEASGPRISLAVLFDTYAEMSEGMDSNPHDGITIEPVLVAW